MIIYLIKFSSVLLVLLIFYRFSLENERAFSFNRIFLLASLIFSISIPFAFITVEADFASLPLGEVVAVGDEKVNSINDYVALQLNQSSRTIGSNSIFIGFYFLIAGALLVRFVFNLSKMIMKCLSVPAFVKEKYHIVLVDQNMTPNSFFNYIFLNRSAFEKGEIDQAIIAHERRHADALHSIDVILIELALVVFWFNPIVYWLKQNILLNHEFEADQQESRSALRKYQDLIFQQIYINNSNSLASGFNYSFIKKRMNMLQKTRSGPLLQVKQLLVIPLLLSLSFIACEKVIAQNEKVTIESSEGIIEMMTVYNGKKVSNAIYYHSDVNGPVDSEVVARLLRNNGMDHLDKLTVHMSGKKHQLKDLAQVEYTEAKEDLFMRKLHFGNSLLIIRDEERSAGKKYRAINLGEGQKRSVTYDASMDRIPPPPPAPPAPPVPPTPPAPNSVSPPAPPVAPSAPTVGTRIFKRFEGKESKENIPPRPPAPPASVAAPQPSLAAVPPPPAPVADAAPPPPPLPSIDDLEKQIASNLQQIELLSKTKRAEDIKQVEKYKSQNQAIRNLIEKHKN